MTIDPLLDAVVRFALAGVLAWAAAHKLRDLPAFTRVVSEYRLLPGGAERWVAPGLAGVEILLAAALAWPTTRVLSGGATSLLMLSYSLAIGINLRRGRRDLDCGCFGPTRRQPLSEWLLLRNGLLFAASLAAVLPIAPRPLGLLDSFAGGAAVLALGLLWTAADRLLVQWPALRALRRRT